MNQPRLRIAIQKKGRLSTDCHLLLKACGIKINVYSERLIVHASNMPIDLLLVRDDDIPGLIMDDIVDLAIIGENVLEEISLEREHCHEENQYKMLKKLDFGSCRLSLAIEKEQEYHDLSFFEDKRIATSYPQLVKRYFESKGINASTCMLNGSVEVAPRAGIADAICDLVSTGATLEANGLKEVKAIFYSTAVLIQTMSPLNKQKQELIDTLLTRMQGVIQAKESKYIMLHAPKNQLDQIIDLLPGAENPTILPLMHDDDRVAVHVVSSENLFWETMEAIKQLGASSILVLPIEKMME